MRYLILGSGGREHALAWKLATEGADEVLVAPGSDGIDTTARCRSVSVGLDDHEALKQIARDEAIDLTIVGPEAPLCAGVADTFRHHGLAIFGPGAEAARLEGSKAFAKEVMAAAEVPTAAYSAFTDLDAAIRHVSDAPHPLVIKADGLAGGKGVVISESRDASETTLREFMAGARFGDASSRVVVEDALRGPEVSFMVITDGEHIVTLPTSRDHKRVGDGDSGPNTGGMGAVVPSPHASADLEHELVETVVRPVLHELARRGIEYCGFLYAGLMLTDDGPRVLEFNVRLGDPETQALMFGMEEELGPVLYAAATGALASDRVLASRSACCVVLAAEGYPAAPRRGDVIAGLSSDERNTFVFHAGTSRRGDEFVTSGGRVLGVTARGDDPADARRRAYDAASRISWRGMHYRRDIGV